MNRLPTVQIQTILTQLGFSPGRIDGAWGERTENAVREFQRVKGLKVDGKVGPITAAALLDESTDRPLVEDLPADTAPPSAWPRQADMVRFYGEVGQNQTTIELPWPMRLAWAPDQYVHRFACHEKVHDSLSRVLTRIGSAYDRDTRRALGLDLFGGCLNVRKMRGGSAWSMHSWGVALDFDPARNQLKWGRDKARLAQQDCEEFWRIWEAEGWLSLGRARNFDWMHVQAARL